MTTMLPTQIAPIEIDWYDSNEVVSVNPRDQQRFEVQKDAAIEILRVTSHHGRFEKQMNLLLSRLGEWIRSHAMKVERGFLTLQDGSLAFVVVKMLAEVDEKLEDSLSELDVAIANDDVFDLIRLNTLALPPAPPESLLSFLDTRFLVSFDGKRKRARHAGKQKPRVSGSSAKSRRSTS